VNNIELGHDEARALKPNFKGFMVDNAHANWNGIQIVYGFGDVSEIMVDKE
jgi:hypothetical protein